MKKSLQHKHQKGYLPNLSVDPLVIQAVPVAIAHPPRTVAGFHATDQSLGETVLSTPSRLKPSSFGVEVKQVFVNYHELVWLVTVVVFNGF